MAHAHACAENSALSDSALYTYSASLSFSTVRAAPTLPHTILSFKHDPPASPVCRQPPSLELYNTLDSFAPSAGRVFAVFFKQRALFQFVSHLFPLHCPQVLFLSS